MLNEIIVVEGRDDTAAVRRALDAQTIETHGFGIRAETWSLLENAYRTRGLIIFTDPDHSGEMIRRKLTERFPNAGQAFLSRNQAEKAGDIGIENASPEAIRQALALAHGTHAVSDGAFTAEDLDACGLGGTPGAAARRDRLGSLLGIGYGNTKNFLHKLNAYGITKEVFYEALRKI